jgi:activating signal cointegrator complex subunit 1
MGGRKKKVCINDDSKKEKTMKSIWRPITTNASSCEGLSFLSRPILATDL